MSYKIKKGLLFGALIAVAISAYFIIVYLYKYNNEGSKEKIDNDLNNTIIDLGDADKGIIESGDDVMIDSDKLDSLKDLTEGGVGDLSIEPGNNPTKEPTQNENTTEEKAKKYVLGIDWSNGELSETELASIIDVMCGLYGDKLSVDGTKYVVQGVFPQMEELQKFKVPIFYFAENGVLTLNLKLSIYNLDKGTMREVLTPISIKYNLDKVELIH